MARRLPRVNDGQPSDPRLIQKRARSSQANGGVPVISGLTLKRRIRAHAVKIATLCRGDVEGQALVDRMFGGTSRASRVSVGFGWIEGGQTNLALPRIKIDRLTGGVIDSALFWSLPVSSDLLDSQHRANLSIAIELRKRSGEDAIDPAEIGLLMHCLKDVWTQKVSFGKAVFGGRLQGNRAKVSHGPLSLELDSRDQVVRHSSPGLIIRGDREYFEECGQALKAIDNPKEGNTDAK